MLLTEQDPTQTCPVAPVTDPAELDKKRTSQEDLHLANEPRIEAKQDPTVIGHYQLLNQLGRGSTGVVWRALDLGHVRREVALKILHADQHDDHARLRFTNEVRALACLDDPQIAKVWDNGQTKDGRLYLSMELVSGLSLLKYCETWNLSIRERLELVLKICQGIQHAHHRLILHRDLKPANILVTVIDGQPVPKIIDFGLAKWMHGPLVPAAIETTQRGCLIGTIGYMSPEQAELDQRDVDVRSDVYAVCAILYELLTGTLPISREDLHRHSLTEALKLVREREPDLASQRVSHDPNGTVHAAHCRLSVPALTQALNGDLDAILMKGLSKDRSQRYQSASELADDIRRYLHGSVVQARKRTYWYVAQKWMRKHWKAAAILMLVSTLFLISWATAITGYFIVKEERNNARNWNEKAQTSLKREVAAKLDAIYSIEFVNNVFSSPRPSKLGAHATQLEVLDDSLEEVKKHDARPRVACWIRTAWARLYLHHQQAAKAKALLQDWINHKFDDPDDHKLCLAPLRESYIRALLELGNYEQVVQEAEHFFEDHPQTNDDDIRKFHVLVRRHLVTALAELKQFEKAKQLIEQSMPAQGLPLNDQSTWTDRIALLDFMAVWAEYDPSKSEAALALAEQYLGPAQSSEHHHQITFNIKLKCVAILTSSKQYDRALETLDELTALLGNEQSIPFYNQVTAIPVLELTKGRVHYLHGDKVEAEKYYRSAISKSKPLFATGHQVLQHAVRSLIELEVSQHKYWQALGLYPGVALAVGNPDDLSTTALAMRREYEKTLASALAQFAFWNLR